MNLSISILATNLKGNKTADTDQGRDKKPEDKKGNVSLGSVSGGAHMPLFHY